MCGIFGYAGKSYKQFNKLKFDILGIYNDSRGGDSCGVSTDGEIYYGASIGMKHYKDFLVEKNYLPPTKFPVVIGHTRKSSHGIVNENNAHPFGFGLNEEFDSYEFIGVHNGTLYNHDDLAKENNIEVNIYNTLHLGNKQFVRSKIDSEILLECIYRTKSFKVLSEYTGGAALLFTDTTKSNVLYAFHGASATYSGGKIEEERPLFYYRENKNSLYISSLAESLIAIGGVLNETIFEFDCNVVYKITNGDIDNAEKINISRNKAFQRKIYNHNNYTTDKIYGYNGNNLFTNFNTKKGKKEKEVLENVNNIYQDSPNRILPSPIVFNKLRYERNGHLLKGIFTFVPNYGIIPLYIEPHEISTKISSLIGARFNLDTGLFLSDKAIVDINIQKNIIIPFSISEKKVPCILYMYDGVHLKTQSDYIACNEMKFKDYIQLSHASKHPLINSEYAFRTVDNQNIMLNGELYTGNISPFCSGKIYHIEDGKLIKIVNIKEVIDENISVSKPVIHLPISTQNDDDFVDNLKESILIDKPIENFQEEENDEDETLSEITYENDLEGLEEILSSIYQDVDNINNSLNNNFNGKMKDIKSELIQLNKSYLESLDTLSLKIIK